jgi:phospholipid/cholesterol/gamma-HCH transport system substrate-binding protein
MRRSESTTLKVGALVAVAVALLATAIFLIGEQNQLFRRKNVYHLRLTNAQGLQDGNPVQINGFAVGSVQEVVLPKDLEDPRLVVRIAIDRRHAERIREDSMASIRTLGLLGDKYVEILSGTPAAPVIPDGGEIPAQEATDLDKLISSGGDVAGNLLAISASLVRILEELEKGESFVGDLLSGERAQGRSASQALFGTLDSLRETTDTFRHSLEEGEGPLPRLLHDRELADRLASSITRLESVLTAVDEGEGALPALLHDAEMRQRLEGTLASLQRAGERLDRLSARLEEGEGLLPRLLNDEEFGREVATELQELLRNLSGAMEKINAGDGTLGKLIEDPHIYQALNDIVVGINDSKILRWLIRNRQRAGIKHRLKEEMESPPPIEPRDE